MNTTIATTPVNDHARSDAATGHHDWRAAGAAWGRRADDWACLYERYSQDVVTTLIPRLGDLSDRRTLDIACGSGLVTRQLELLGADVAGIDASAQLLDVARRRTSRAELVHGSMFDLPWPDQQFDVAVSINGIWGGCQPALDEAHRVLRPGGILAITFWGAGPPNDLRATFKTFARNSPDDHFSAMKRLNNIAHDGVAETMLTGAGFGINVHYTCPAMLEWPDPEIAWRAISSTGPAVPALDAVNPDALRADLLSAIEPYRDDRGTYRLFHKHHAVIAQRPQ